MNPSQLFDSHIQRAYFEKDDASYRSLLAVREEVLRWEEKNGMEMIHSLRKSITHRTHASLPLPL